MRDADADPAEAALLVAAEARSAARREDVVSSSLLRLEALADVVRTETGDPSGTPTEDADRLQRVLGGALGFRGHGPHDRGPEDGLLDVVLERRRGLPITLTIVYVAVARRVGIRAYPIALPGHVVTGVVGPAGTTEPPVVLDPFGGGQVLDEAALTALVTRATGGQLRFTRSMLRPAPLPRLVRRLLNNLTHDYTRAGRLSAALWTVECKLALPDQVDDDHRVHGRLLEQLGRFDQAARAYQAYVESAGDGPDVAEVRAAAVRARARTN